MVKFQFFYEQAARLDFMHAFPKIFGVENLSRWCASSS